MVLPRELRVEAVEPLQTGTVQRVTFSDGTLLDTPAGALQAGERVRLSAVAAREGETHVDPLPFDPSGDRYVCYGCVYDRERGHAYASFGGLLMRCPEDDLGGCGQWFYLRAEPAAAQN